MGNLRDLSLRAFDALMEADVIVCEDTRITGKLFKMIKTKNLDQDINTFQENEKEEENDEKVFDYLS